MQLEQLSSSIITPRSNLRIQFLKLNNDGRVLISLGKIEKISSSFIYDIPHFAINFPTIFEGQVVSFNKIR